MDIGSIAITVVSQPTSRRSQQYVFSRTRFSRNVSGTTIPAIQGTRITIIKRRARGRRDPIILYTFGHIDAYWGPPPAPPGGGNVGSLYVSWPIRDHRYRHDGRRIR